MKYLWVLIWLFLIFVFWFIVKTSPYLKLANNKEYNNPYEKIINWKYNIIDELDWTDCWTWKVIDIWINHKIYWKQYIFFPTKTDDYDTYNKWYDYITWNDCLNYLKNNYWNNVKYYKFTEKGVKIDRIIIWKYIFDS